MIKGIRIEVHYGCSHRFKPASLKIISRVGLNARILDLGGGDRHLALPNFVNLDVVKKNKSVDIVGDAHRSPFKDDTFDVILCESVFEHLKKPWIVVEELHRVLKHDGFVYVETAFLQPAHDNYYFSMTKEGIESLMADRFIKINSGIQPYQMPSYTLALFLSQYVRCIFPYIYKTAKNGKVYDTNSYISSPSKSSVPLVFMFAAFLKFLRFLDRFFDLDRAQVLAAGVYFLGTKK